MTTHVTDEGSRMNDYDFKECMKYAPFAIEDVKDILACVAGEADGPNWHYIVELKNGQYGYVTGGCDYTGWGCQENGSGKLGTLEECLNESPIEDGYGMKRNVRETLQAQIDGKEPYGVITLRPE